MGSYFSISISAVENSTDIINNTSNVTVSLWCNGSNGYADDNPSYWLKVNGNVVSSGTRNFSYENFTVTTWTGNVTHNSDGSGSITYQGYFQGTDKPNGDTTPVYTLNLTKLDRESELLDGTTSRAIDGEISFSVDKKNQNFSDKLTIYPVSNSSLTTVVSPYTTGSTVQIGASTLTSIKALAPTTTYTSMVIQVETFASGTSIGSTSSIFRGSFTAAPPSITPIWSASPTNNIIATQDSVIISLGTSASPDEGTTISAYEFTIGSTTITTTGYSVEFDSVASNDVSVKIIDRRGLSTTVSTNNLFEIEEYSEPKITSISINRYPTLIDTGAQIRVEGTYSYYTFRTNIINGYYTIGSSTTSNALSITQNSNGTFSGITTIPTNTFDAAQEYKVNIRIDDNYSDIHKQLTLSKAAITLDMDLTNQRVGIGQPVPEATSGSDGLVSGGLIVSGKIKEEGQYLEDKYGGINQQQLLNLIYPIGSIYMSTTNVSPATFLGGTWMQIEESFLLSASSTYTAGLTGGEAKHTLTVSEMPSHSHAQYVTANAGTGSITRADFYGDASTYSKYDQGVNTHPSGGGQAHNNMPPYLTVYMWERIEDFPSGVSYTFVRGLQNSGTQYIDLGFVPTFNMGISLRTRIDTDVDKVMAGCIENGSGLLLVYYNSNFRIRAYGDSTSYQKTYSTGNLLSSAHTYQYNYLNDGVLLIDGMFIDSPSGTLPKGSVVLSHNLNLFANNNGGTASPHTNLTIYDCSITEGTQLTHRLKPAVRASDSKPGLYDLVTQNFYTNSGTGEFITV